MFMNFRNKIPGICDRCGQRYRLNTLKEELILGKKTSLLVCKRCWDPSQPQLDTRGLRTDDKQYVKNPRSDIPELAESRKLFSWNPVGNPTNTEVDTNMGRVTVKTS